MRRGLIKGYMKKNMNVPHNHYRHKNVEPEHANLSTRGREIAITIKEEE